MTRTPIDLALGTGVALFVLATATAANAQEKARTYVAPYIEAAQVLDADLDNGDVLTYSQIAVGVNAGIDTRRASGQLSYRYERRIAWNDRVGDGDVHTGLARGLIHVVPGLSIEGGALATRARSDIRGAAPGILTGNVGNISQIYTVYAGPTYATQAGPVSVNALYRIGYTKVETPTFSGLSSTQPRLDYYDHSLGQLASFSAGVAPGAVLPVGLTASAGYEREDGSQLKQRYEDVYGRGDVLAPVSANVALTAGVGYEYLETSQRDALRDAAGAPVLDRNGRFVTDPASPRRIAYRTDGVYYDAGVVWRPNRRTSVEGHVGYRYGGTTVFGTATYQASRSVGLAVNVYDSVQTFGRQLRTGLANLPTSFVTQRDQLAQQFNGCVFGATGAAPGGCLDSVFQSISTASYRARGIDGIITATRGLNTFGAGAGYSNRRLHAPDVPSGIVVYGLEDESYYAQLFYARALSPTSGVNLNAFANYYTSQLIGSDDVLSLGGTASYYRSFGRLSTTGSLGLYHFEVGNLNNATSAQALLAARYQF